MTPEELGASWPGSLRWCPVSRKSGQTEQARGQELADWCKAQGDWDLEVVEHAPGTRGFSIQPRRWVVERTLGWLSRNRRLSKDYERKVQTSETLIQVAMIRLLIARLGRNNESVPKQECTSGLIVHDQENDPV
jgi:hypothetical protein